MNSKASNATALILIGYQNDYFSEDGILHSVIEEVERVNHVLANTIDLLQGLVDTETLIVSTPIIFTEDYSELQDPAGILKVIKDTKAFCKNSKGSETIEEFHQFGDRIKEIPGKRGLNAFSNTQLDELLRQRKVKHIVFAGAVTSVCIDSTARAAFEKGYKISILSDCTTGRTIFEQEFYCNDIFPIYAEVINHKQLVEALSVPH